MGLNNPNLSTKSLTIVEKILSQNDIKAQALRDKFQHLGLYVINLMSAPGSGKTTLLESLSDFKDFRFCVLEGDLQTSRDADRLQTKGINAYQITTGEACHLEASMIESGFNALQKQCDISKMEYLFIENVGNLVCPASYDVGANVNLVLLSTVEGDDKILKYPSMFLCADGVIISKADMMPFVNFDLHRVKADLSKIKADVPLWLISHKDSNSIAKVRDFCVQSRLKGYQSTYRF